MSHDHEALYLAVASFDFELSADEQARMQTGLSECAECAEIAASHSELTRLLGRLPAHDASPHVRQRILRAALVPPRARPWPVLLVAAALLGLLIAGAAAVGAFRQPRPLDLSVAPPSASLPALGDLASPAPSGTPAPGSSEPGEGGSGPGFGAPLPPDTLAEVVSGRLRIRSAPRVADDSIKYEPLLDVGDRLFILDGPVVANDYEWYEVMAWRPGDLYAYLPVGWVARGDHDGSPWLRPGADTCPTGTITMEIVEELLPQERVACFGDGPLRLRAYVQGGAGGEPCTPEPDTACIDGPTWLTVGAGVAGWVEADTGTDAPLIAVTPLAIDPDGPVPISALPDGSMVELEGAFDHPAARDCRPGAVGPGAEPVLTTVAQLSCRARFVVTRVTADADYPSRGTAAVTVSDNLRVRAVPGLGGERFELLRIGTRVWVVDGPVVAADYEWFQVIVPAIDAGEGAPRVGWVAASDHGVEPWLERATLACPNRASLVVEDLLRLTAPGYGDGGLACFGSATLRVQGTIGMVCGGEDRPGWSMAPEWLSPNAFSKLMIQDGEAIMVARPRPNVDMPVSCGEIGTERFFVDGHFNDDLASECEATVRSGAMPSDFDHVPRYLCQTTLVIERVTPVTLASPRP